MAKRLGKFELPKRLVKDEATATETYAKFVAEPFETGFGYTIGNALRRVLLGLKGLQSALSRLRAWITNFRALKASLKTLPTSF